MHTRMGFAIGALVIAGVSFSSRHIAPVAQATPVPVEGQGSSTLDDQTELAVTVYNSDIALVRDVRELRLPQADLRSAGSWTSPRP